ncbi:MAG: hypothetical protein ABWX68_02375 [Arthrobacter sp.]
MRYEIRVDGRVDPSAVSDFATVTAAVQPGALSKPATLPMRQP